MSGYAALVMILSAIVKFLLLLGANRLCGGPVRWSRFLLAAQIWGLYSGFCLLPRFFFLANTLWRFLGFVILILIAFGMNFQALRSGAVFILLNMALEGVASGFRVKHLWYPIIGVVVIGVLCAIGFHNKNNRDFYIPLEISYGIKKIRLTALRDTGNTLMDPVTGKSVLVVGADAACQLTGLTQKQLKSPLETITSAKIPGLRLIPYHTIGQGVGFLLAIKMMVKIDGNTEKCLVAFAPEGLSREGTHQALAGGTV